MADSNYPNARPWKDRHGITRWRFRHKGKTVYLPGAPGDPEFEAAYQAAIRGEARPKPAQVIAHPNRVLPKSIKAAWRSYKTTSPDWQRMELETRNRQEKIADLFLSEPVAEDATQVWGDMPIADLKRRHLKSILTAMSATPFAARHRLSVIRKMIEAALDEEWIDADPSHKLNFRPQPIKGWRAWTDDEMLAYEKRWPIGTTPRLIYELALWLGPRRCDLATLTPKHIHDDIMVWKQRKTQKTTNREVRMPITPAVKAVLAVTDLTGETIVRTAFGDPFSIKSLTGRMRDWTAAAGLTGCTLHGLRKTLGKRVAEAGGTTKQTQSVLGHDTLQQAELYTEEAERERLARDAMEKAFNMVTKQRAKRSG